MPGTLAGDTRIRSLCYSTWMASNQHGSTSDTSKIWCQLFRFFNQQIDADKAKVDLIKPNKFKKVKDNGLVS